MKTIVIAGANGFVGRYLSKHFLDKGWTVKGLARREQGLADGVEFVLWDGETLGDWQGAIEGAEVVVNLVGRTVNCRYTDVNKRQIMDSRVNSTRVIGEAIAACEKHPEVWVNASAISIYEESFDHYQTEAQGKIAEGFNAEVVKQWEKTHLEADVPDSVRKISFRISLVMAGEKGTVLEILRGIAKKGLGGQLANGKQMVSWIHINDLCRSMEWMIENKEAKGAYNITSPNAVTNAEMMRHIRQDVGAFIGLPAMGWMVKIGAFIMGTESELILKSSWVYPERLLDKGFVFERERFEDVLG